MGKDVSRILAIAEPIAAERGLEILDIEIAGTASNRILRVLLDSPAEDRRVGIEDCQAVSHLLGDALEAYEALSGRYMLEVSSPGVNRPLKRIEHFQRVLGCKVKIRTRLVPGGKATRLGRLDEVDDAGVSLTEETGETTRIPFEDIEKANLEFEFENKAARPGRKSTKKKRR